MTNTSNPRNHAAVTYCAITFLFSWSAWVLATREPNAAVTISIFSLNLTWTLQDALAMIGNLVPGIVAILMLVAAGKPLRPLLDQFHFPSCSKFLFLFSIATPIVLNFLLLVAEEGMRFEVDETHIVLFLTTFALNLFLGPLWEEIGWRGYLLPALLRSHSATSAVAVTGVIWSVWHSVLYLLVLRVSLFSFAINFAGIVALSVVLAALYMVSDQNLILPILFHVSWNTGLSLINRLEPTLHAHSLIIQTIALWVIAVMVWFFYREEIQAVAARFRERNLS